HEAVATFKPDYIINCAAYTAVDSAESNKERAYAINATAVEKLAQIANQFGATLIHFSTDYVFDGNATTPYRVNYPTAPINVYGASKLAGEEAIRRTGSAHYIFRVSWLFAPHGKNFFRWVAETDMEELNIVDSQTGSPTSALDVAAFIKHLIKNDPAVYGTYHFTNTGSCTWFAFAKAINDKLSLNKKINPVASFKTAASRPTYSVMDCSETEKTFDYKIPSIEDGLEHVIKSYKS
ncbi:MAG: dTDP-4-dehydrorhamnose reductase, partial [Nonlabens sp.]|nr:dTDP-4-dehydrorhamnose reductase [Nonlabens sp.]